MADIVVYGIVERLNGGYDGLIALITPPGKVKIKSLDGSVCCQYGWVRTDGSAYERKITFQFDFGMLMAPKNKIIKRKVSSYNSRMTRDILIIIIIKTFFIFCDDFQLKKNSHSLIVPPLSPLIK